MGFTLWPVASTESFDWELWRGDRLGLVYASVAGRSAAFGFSALLDGVDCEFCVHAIVGTTVLSCRKPQLCGNGEVSASWVFAVVGL